MRVKCHHCGVAMEYLRFLQRQTITWYWCSKCNSLVGIETMHNIPNKVRNWIANVYRVKRASVTIGPKDAGMQPKH